MNTPSVPARAHEQRILLAEDDTQGGKLITMMLRKVGFAEVRLETNGSEALQAYEEAEGAYDLVISDWNMPGLTGIELLKAVRERDYRQPFIMITGRGLMESAVEAKAEGVNAYLAKPYTPRQLLEKVTTVLDAKFEQV